MQKKPDYYAILQVSRSADPAVIKAAYYTQLKVLKKHPDLGGDHDEATLLNEAYEVLSNPIQRREYDRKADASGPKAQPASPVQTTREQRRAVRAVFERNFRYRVYSFARDEPALTRVRRDAKTPPPDNSRQRDPDWIEAQFRDISLLGSCFRSAEKFKVAQTLEFDISQTPMVRAIAKVRWVRTLPQRFGPPLYEGGVEFEKINPALFREFLKKAGLEILL